jgi:alpha-L-rhamnosidase
LLPKRRSLGRSFQQIQVFTGLQFHVTHQSKLADISPASQTVKRKVTVNLNQEFADIADTSLTPTHSWIEYPREVVRFEPSTEDWFGYRPIHSKSIEELAYTPLGKEDQFILDFGSHRVGYFSFYLNAIGENVDAPC